MPAQLQRFFFLGLAALSASLGYGTPSSAQQTEQPIETSNEPSLSREDSFQAYVGTQGTLHRLPAQGRLMQAIDEWSRLQTDLPKDGAALSSAIDQLRQQMQAEVQRELERQDSLYDSLVRELNDKFSARAAVDEYDDLIHRIVNTAHAESGQSPDGKLGMLLQVVTEWQDYLFCIKNGDPDRSVQSLNNVIALAGELPVLPRSQLLELRQSRQLGSRPADVHRIDAYDQIRAELSDLLARVERAAELDAYILKLSKSDQFPDLDRIWRCAAVWQNFLHARETGNTSATKSNWDFLARTADFNDIFSQAQATRKLFGHASQQTPFAAELVSPEKVSIANTDLLADQLRFRRDHGLPLDFNPDQPIKVLYELNMARNLVYQGNLEGAIGYLERVDEYVGEGPPHPYKAVMGKIGCDLKKMTLPDFYSAPREIAVTDGETKFSYEEKLLAYGYKQQDWPLIYRVHLVRYKLRRSNVDRSTSLKAFGWLVDGCLAV